VARDLIQATPIPATGLAVEDTIVQSNQADGNRFKWSPSHRLVIKNTDAATRTHTLVTPGTVGPLGLAITDATVVVAAGKTVVLPAPGPEYRRNDHEVWINFDPASAATTQKLAVLDIG